MLSLINIPELTTGPALQLRSQPIKTITDSTPDTGVHL